MFKTAMTAFLALSLTFGAASANDTSFGGEGATLLPIENHEIAMVDEHIVIEGMPDKRPDFPKLKGWKTTCTFHFRNDSSSPQTITMGFPFPRPIDVDREGTQLEELDAKMKKVFLTPMIAKFTTKVRNVDVKSKEIEIKDPSSPYRNAWVWDVTFAPGETVEVVNTYEHEASGNSEYEQEITYVLRTGKNWKGGKIGRSLLEVKPNLDFYPVPGELAAEYEVQPKGARIEADGAFKKVIWDLKDFEPKSDLRIRFIPAEDFVKYRMESTLPEVVEPDGSCKELRILRNALYAWFGYSFKNADLKKHFEKQWWYKADPGFDLQKLSDLDRRALTGAAKVVKAAEKEKACK